MPDCTSVIMTGTNGQRASTTVTDLQVIIAPAHGPSEFMWVRDIITVIGAGIHSGTQISGTPGMCLILITPTIFTSGIIIRLMDGVIPMGHHISRIAGISWRLMDGVILIPMVPATMSPITIIT